MTAPFATHHASLKSDQSAPDLGVSRIKSCRKCLKTGRCALLGHADTEQAKNGLMQYGRAWFYPSKRNQEPVMKSVKILAASAILATSFAAPSFAITTAECTAAGGTVVNSTCQLTAEQAANLNATEATATADTSAAARTAGGGGAGGGLSIAALLAAGLGAALVGLGTSNGT